MLVVYDTTTRAIKSIVSTTIGSGQAEFASTTDSVSPSTHYAPGSPPVVTERPEAQASLDGHTLSAAEGSIWTLTNTTIGFNVSGEVGSDEEVEFEFEDTGTYTLVVTNFPDLDFTAEIEVA